MQVKATGPFRFDLSFYSNRGEFVNRAKGAVASVDLQTLPKDADGNHVLKLYWWPVSSNGQAVGTGAYIMRGGIVGEGLVDVKVPLQPGFTHLPNKDNNISVVFGFLRR